MTKRVPIETPEERQQAEDLWRELGAAADRYAPGWMRDGSGLDDVIARLERAIDQYDRVNDRD